MGKIKKTPSDIFNFHIFWFPHTHRYHLLWNFTRAWWFHLQSFRGAVAPYDLCVGVPILCVLLRALEARQHVQSWRLLFLCRPWILGLKSPLDEYCTQWNQPNTTKLDYWICIVLMVWGFSIVYFVQSIGQFAAFNKWERYLLLKAKCQSCSFNCVII